MTAIDAEARAEIERLRADSHAVTDAALDDWTGAGRLAPTTHGRRDVMAAASESVPYVVPCRWCGEAVAVRMASGRLRAHATFVTRH